MKSTIVGFALIVAGSPPSRGAWIEINYGGPIGYGLVGRPLAGAWIEDAALVYCISISVWVRLYFTAHCGTLIVPRNLIWREEGVLCVPGRK